MLGIDRLPVLHAQGCLLRIRQRPDPGLPAADEVHAACAGRASAFQPRLEESDIFQGLWIDPVTRQRFELSDELDADHIVPLSWAWTHGGASQWDQAKRVAFANDPENFWLLHSPVNSSKGDSVPGEWCEFKTELLDQEVLGLFREAFERIRAKYGLNPLQSGACPKPPVVQPCTP